MAPRNLTLYLAILALCVFAALPSLAAPTGNPRTPPPLGNLFSKTDPDGSLRLASAADQRLRYETTGSGRLAGFPAWDLANVRGRAYVTTVKNQGGCGSCVAHAALSSLETTINYKTSSGVDASVGLNPLPDFSEQSLYFCLGKRGCQDGWWINEAFEIAKDGIVDEACLPLSDSNSQCTASCPRTIGSVKGGTVRTVALNSWEEVKAHIVNHGPVATGFTVFSDFPGYEDSNELYSFPSTFVWPGTKTRKAKGGHAVVCHGFDDNMLNGINATSRGVIFCKNSWGVGWGDQGLFKMAYGADGIISGGDNAYGFQWTAGVAPNVPSTPPPSPVAVPPPPPPPMPRTTKKKVQKKTAKAKRTTKAVPRNARRTTRKQRRVKPTQVKRAAFSDG